jgi:hypothetical protein
LRATGLSKDKDLAKHLMDFYDTWVHKFIYFGNNLQSCIILILIWLCFLPHSSKCCFQYCRNKIHSQQPLLSPKHALKSTDGRFMVHLIFYQTEYIFNPSRAHSFLVYAKPFSSVWIEPILSDPDSSPAPKVKKSMM